MLIKYYNPTTSKQLNHTPLHTEHDIHTNIEHQQQVYKTIKYYTTPLDVFDNHTTQSIQQLIHEQFKTATEEANLLLKHSYLTQSTYKHTLLQYQRFFFYDHYTYNKNELIQYVSDQNLRNLTYLEQPTNQTSPTQTHPTQPQSNITFPPSEILQHHNTVRVSKEAIRNITGYSYNAIREWDQTHTPVYVKWQHDLLNDEHEIIVVDGSRQMGKSFTISQKLIEESHIPNNDSLVGAFLEKTTNVIRNYVLRLTRKFPHDYFTHFKKEGYIINNKTLTKIYFRTLSDGGDNVLGLTLKRAIIDEAQFVPDSTFEDAINPTLSTTGGQLIMIGTPAKKKTGYMYKTIMDIKRNVLSSEEASYYRISVDQNPFIHPKKRKFIHEHRNEQSIQRQYYNAWGDIGDSLFSIQQEPTFPTIELPNQTNNQSNNFIVMGIDPARLNDRSGNSLLYVHYNPETEQHQITIILSGFVPDSHKKRWELQASYYTRLIEKWSPQPTKQQPIQQQSPNWYNVIDVTGVGDGVVTIFQQAGIKISGKIRYTSGLVDSESKDGVSFNVAKTILINNFIDMCQEGTIKVFNATNKDLLEEVSYIEEGESRSGQVTMKSDFYDDICNATMIAAYYIKKRRLLGRSSTQQSPYRPTGNQMVDAIENRQSTPQLSSTW